MPDTPRLPARAPESIEAAVAALRDGAIVGMPTETVYGVAVLPTPDALARLVAAKARSPDKGVALLIDGLDQVEHIVVIDPVALRLAARFWPGPLTLALPLRPGIEPDALLTGGRGTLGLRIPDHPVPRAVARLLGPIAVSSANISGEPPALTPDALLDSIGEALALVLDDGPVRGGIASTVAAVAVDGTVVILRSGALSEAEVRAALA